MIPEQIKRMVCQARDAWTNGDAEGFASLFLPTGEFIVPGNRWQGREAIRSILAEFADTHTEIKIEIRRILLDRDSALVEWFWQDAETKTGKQTQADDAIAIDFEQGLIKRWREYIDAETPKRHSRLTSTAQATNIPCPLKPYP